MFGAFPSIGRPGRGSFKTAVATRSTSRNQEPLIIWPPGRPPSTFGPGIFAQVAAAGPLGNTQAISEPPAPRLSRVHKPSPPHPAAQPQVETPRSSSGHCGFARPEATPQVCPAPLNRPSSVTRDQKARGAVRSTACIPAGPKGLRGRCHRRGAAGAPTQTYCRGRFKWEARHAHPAPHISTVVPRARNSVVPRFVFDSC